MQKNSSSESGLFTPRVLIAFVLCSISALLAALSFAANPKEGSVTTATAAPLTWRGTGNGVPPTAAAACVEGANCDSFKLTISGTPEDWVAAGKQVRVRIDWLVNANDYDLTVHKGSVDGPVVGSSGSLGGTFEQVTLNPRSKSVGTGDFYVKAVYFAVAAADQYTGSARVEDSGPPPVTAVAPTSGVAPRYQNYTPPARGPVTLGLRAAEPSIGVNWNTENVPARPGHATNGGRSMYITLEQTLRITFDDSCPSTPSALWEDKSFPTTSVITFDPILYTDNSRRTGPGGELLSLATNRTVVSQLLFPAGSVTTASAYTDNDGDTWLESTGAAPGAGIDHQTIGGGGPFHAPVPPLATYPNAIYYCAQLPNASCGLSIDGGRTYGPAVPAYTDECGGLHGHIKVGPDGTAYLPNKKCNLPVPGQAVVVSEDNGVTWQERPVPGSLEGGSDAAVGIGRGDKTGGKGRVYLGYADGDSSPVITTSTDNGRTWSPPVDVGAVFGINNVAFPAVVAGDDDRAAFAFYGTPTEGGLQDPKFTGIWHLYVAHTYDGGQTWQTVDVTPNDPMQRGCIWLGGGANICRNMLDFMGIDVDKRGRVLVAYNDGCAGAECSQARPEAVGNSYTQIAAIARQSGGKGLFAAHDGLFPDAPAAPGAPYVTALRNGGKVNLQWSLSNSGGSPVTEYTISRGTTPGSGTAIATVPGNQLRFVDRTATDSASTYYYTVAATNAQGTSCGSNEVPTPYVGDSHSPAGYTIYSDPTADGTAAAHPDLDIQTLSISEPSTGPHAGKLVFNLKVANMAISPNERMWRIIWDSPNAAGGKFYVGMTKNETGAVSFEYGTVSTAVVGLVLGLPRTNKVGDADAGSFTPQGLISIVLSRDKVATKEGDLMGNFAVRTYNVVTREIRTNNAIDQATNATANDLTANAATYQVVGPRYAQLQNISTRALVQPGDNALIGGFIITGADSKRVLLRGLGPSLTGRGVSGALQDPRLELHNSATGAQIRINDNWKDSQQGEIEETTIPPANDAEAAIVQTLLPGAYTAVLREAADRSGVGLVEVYDLDQAGDAKLANISSRGTVQTDDNVMIGGFIVGPPDVGSARTLLRAIGPSLTARGVPDALQDPILEVYDGNGTLLATNDGWRDSQAPEIEATGMAPTDDREAAILGDAPAGPYTAIVRGKNGTGVGLVEVYSLR